MNPRHLLRWPRLNLRRDDRRNSHGCRLARVFHDAFVVHRCGEHRGQVREDDPHVAHSDRSIPGPPLPSEPIWVASGCETLPVIRLAQPEEDRLLRDVEIASGRLFEDLGMHDVAAAEPTWVDSWSSFQSAGLVWVADEGAGPIGFALAEEVDGNLHLEQLSVLPEHGRRGVGSTLVETVLARAQELGLDAVTLSTFRDVSFNGPFYRRLGFRDLTDEELSDGLRHRRRNEAAHGLDLRIRTMMRREVLSSGNR